MHLFPPSVQFLDGGPSALLFSPPQSIGMKKIFAFLVFALSSIAQFAQSSAYWQQEVNYTIHVTLNDAKHELTGDIQFEYINHSPNELKEIFVHLWPNAYKGKKSALARQLAETGNFFLYYAAANLKGGIDSINFQVNGSAVKWDFFNGYEDIAVLRLDQPLSSGGKLVVSTPFKVRLPSGSISRLGHIGQSYQITQWYPKPAVYDKNGWHPMPYLTQGEFYSEFGSFDVSITLPKNYIIGATGDCQTPSEVEFLDARSKLYEPLDASGKDNLDDFPASDSELKTVRYTQKNVHDFGWFADKRWLVRKGMCVLPHSKDTVTTWAMFTPQNAEVWEETGLKAISDGLYYYSLWSGDYPYKQCTAVDGTISAGGGMEYPNVTVIGSTSTKSQLATVIVHEVGHNWFYGILGSNERDHAWMDEGLNSFFETRTMLAVKDTATLGSISMGGLPIGKMLGLDALGYQYTTEELTYLIAARYGNDQPMALTSDNFTQLNYGGIVYKKTSLVFNYLMQYLGEDMMNACMAHYYALWKFKHPQPEDLKAAFEEKSGKDLDWLFDRLITTNDQVDFAAARIRQKDGAYQLKVRNTGWIDGPFSISVMRGTQTISTQWYDPIQPFETKKVQVQAQKGDVVKVNAAFGIPEFNRHDNAIRTSGLFRKTEPLHLGFLAGVDNPNQTRWSWLPVVAWNEPSKWMLGVNLSNRVVPRRPLEWSITPLYSFNSSKLNGFAHVSYAMKTVKAGVQFRAFEMLTQLPDRWVDVGTPAANSTATDYTTGYTWFHPYVHFNMLSNGRHKRSEAKLKLDAFFIQRSNASVQPFYFVDKGWENRTVYRMSIELGHRWPQTVWKFRSAWNYMLARNAGDEGGFVNPLRQGIDNAISNVNSTSVAYTYLPRKKKKMIFSAFFSPTLEGALPKLAAGQTSQNDMVFEGLYLGRGVTNGLLSRQVRSDWGGIYAPTTFITFKSFVSVNAEVDLPIGLPLALYGGFAQMKDAFSSDIINSASGRDTFLWNAGVTIPIARGIAQVWFPLINSQNIQDQIKGKGLSFGQTIMFELNLDMMNPFDLAAKIARQ